MLQAGAKDRRKRAEPKQYPLAQMPLPPMAKEMPAEHAGQQPQIALGAPMASADVVMTAPGADKGPSTGRERSPLRKGNK